MAKTTVTVEELAHKGPHGIVLSKDVAGLVVDKKSLTFSAQGGSKFIDITSAHPVEIKVKDPQGTEGWLHVGFTPSGAIVTVDPYEEATKTTVREVTLTIKQVTGEKQEAEVKVTQRATSTINFTVTPDVFELSPGDDTKTVTLTTKRAVTTFTGASWLTVTPAVANESGDLTLHAEANTTGTDRRGHLTVTCGAKRITVLCNQPAADFRVIPAQVTLLAAGGVQKLTLDNLKEPGTEVAGASYTVEGDEDITCPDGTVTATKNESPVARHADVKVKVGEVTVVVPVKQLGAK